MKKSLLFYFLFGTIIALTGCSSSGAGDDDREPDPDPVPTGPIEITTVEDLKNISNDLEGDYILMADIDLSGESSWTPIGRDQDDQDRNFSGTFNGNNHTISNLTIVSDYENKGLFGCTYGCLIKNLTLTNVNVSGSGFVGGLVGYNDGESIISNCTVNGTVKSTGTGTVENNGKYVGGLMGYNKGDCTITNCSTAVTVTGTGDSVGGFVGYYWADGISQISDCTASGDVVGHDGDVGGFAGVLRTKVTNCSATGKVTGAGNYVGGFTGSSWYKITNSYASGNVTGVDHIGGFVGNNEDYLTHCYATGNVTGIDNVGGLVGYNTMYANVIGCHASGLVTGSKYVGGLVGLNNIDSDIENSHSSGAVDGWNYVGSLVGYNSDGRIIHCYATGAILLDDVEEDDYVGGLAGKNWDEDATITASFYDSETTGYDTAGGASSEWSDLGTATTTADMKILETFTNAGWDFTDESVNGTDDFWSISASINNGYPHIAELAAIY